MKSEGGLSVTNDNSECDGQGPYTVLHTIEQCLYNLWKIRADGKKLFS